MANEATDQVQWDDQVDTSALNTKAAPTSASAPKSAIQWHDSKDTTALEDPERYALTHPEAGNLPQAAKSSYAVRPVLPSGERVGSMQARADEAPGTVGEQQAIARREAEHPLITAAVKAPAKMSAAGAKMGRDIAAGYVSGATAGPGGGYVVPQGPVTSVEQLRKERPITMGMAEGVGETAGGLVADPTNWLLAATGAEAGPILGKIASAVFTAKMGKDTYEGTRQLIADWDKLTPEERSEQATKLGISALLTEEAGRHAAGGAPELIKTGAEKAKGLIPDNRVVDLLKREAMAKVVPFNERFGINKPTFKDWKNAFKPVETGEAPTAAEPLIPEKPAKFKPGNIRTLKVDEQGNVVDKESSQAQRLQELLEQSLKPAATTVAKPATAPLITEDTTGKGLSKSGASPPVAELIPNEPSAARPAELIPEAKPTAKATTEAKLIPEREPGLMAAGEEGREQPKSAAEYHPSVQEQVGNLTNNNLDKLASAHGIDPTAPEYSRSKEMRSKATDTSSGRHQTGRNKLSADITEQMSDDEKINIGRNAERLAENPDMASKSRAEGAESLFPRLRGPVDEVGNPTGLQGASPRDLNQSLGFGERNTGVTKADKDASIKSFNDKATRSNAGVDPTMLVDAAKVAAYYFEGGVREFGAFSAQMISKLGESIRPHLEELYARAKEGVSPTWKGTAEEWNSARADIEAKTARAKGMPEGPKLPKAMGGPALAEEQPFQGKTTASSMDRYTDPKGQFYKTVLKELQKTTTPDAAHDLAQDVMADFTEGVKDGKFKLPEHTSEEGRITNVLKSIAHNKAADWVNQVQGETASGAPRKLIETKRLSETAGGTAKISTGEEEETTPKITEESKSPYGFGEEPSYRDEHSNARHALDTYLKEHPETAAQDKELLMAASKKSLEKAEAARSRSYDTELARSGDVDKAVEAGRKAEARVNNNKFNSTERYFGLTDAELTKLGQAQHLTGPKFRARLTAIMDDLNSRAEKGTEQPRTGPAPYTGHDSYSNFLSGEGPSRREYSRISTETAPETAKPTETFGNAQGFTRGQPKPEGAISSEGEAKPPVGLTLPLTERLPVGKPLIEPEQRSAQGGRIGTTPVDLKGAEANRERIATARVAEAEQALSEATTPAEQRRARVGLEDAKDRLNYSKAVKQPVSGGSQGAGIHAIAENYLHAIEAGGHPATPQLIPENWSTSLNASGESPASQEAINRTASQRRQGIKTIRIDTRSGRETLIPTVDAADSTAKPYEQIVQRKPDGTEVVMDTGAKAHRRGFSKISLQ